MRQKGFFDQFLYRDEHSKKFNRLNFWLVSRRWGQGSSGLVSKLFERFCLNQTSSVGVDNITSRTGLYTGRVIESVEDLKYKIGYFNKDRYYMMNDDYLGHLVPEYSDYTVQASWETPLLQSNIKIQMIIRETPFMFRSEKESDTCMNGWWITSKRHHSPCLDGSKEWLWMTIVDIVILQKDQTYAQSI